MMRDHMKPDHVAKFWSKVDRSAGPDGCWLWTGTCQKPGERNQLAYGHVYVDIDGKLEHFNAHRLSYILAHGDVPPEGKHVLHACDVPRCVNPRHLWAGTAKENMQDASEKGRLRQQVNAALSKEVRDLRAGGMRVRAIQEKLGLTYNQVSYHLYVIKGRSRRRGW